MLSEICFGNSKSRKNELRGKFGLPRKDRPSARIRGKHLPFLSKSVITLGHDQHPFSMKQSPHVLSLMALLVLAGCADQENSPARRRTAGTNTPDTQFTADANPSPTPDPLLADTNGTVTNGISSVANPFATPTPVPVAAPRDLPYGTPVPGKPGFVTSPHSPSAGYVDVRGVPPGSEVKDPYSGKIFLVP